MTAASNSQIEHMKRFWKETPVSPPLRKLNAKLLKGDFLSLIERVEWEAKQTDVSHARAKMLEERLQAIIDWCDIAMKNADEFDSHGVRNLTGPIFDAARDALEVKT
jgi:hypothetical protein